MKFGIPTLPILPLTILFPFKFDSLPNLMSSSSPTVTTGANLLYNLYPPISPGTTVSTSAILALVVIAVRYATRVRTVNIKRRGFNSSHGVLHSLFPFSLRFLGVFSDRNCGAWGDWCRSGRCAVTEWLCVGGLASLTGKEHSEDAKESVDDRPDDSLKQHQEEIATAVQFLAEETDFLELPELRGGSTSLDEKEPTVVTLTTPQDGQGSGSKELETHTRPSSPSSSSSSATSSSGIATPPLHSVTSFLPASIEEKDEFNRPILPTSLFASWNNGPPIYILRAQLRREHLERERREAVCKLKRELEVVLFEFRTNQRQAKDAKAVRGEEKKAEFENTKLKIASIQAKMLRLQPNLGSPNFDPRQDTEASLGILSVTQLLRVLKDSGAVLEEVEVGVRLWQGWEWDVDLEWDIEQRGAPGEEAISRAERTGKTGATLVSLPHLKKLTITSFDVPLLPIFELLDTPELKVLSINAAGNDWVPPRNSSVINPATSICRPPRSPDKRKRKNAKTAALAIERCLQGEPWLAFLHPDLPHHDGDDHCNTSVDRISACTTGKAALDLLEIQVESAYGLLPKKMTELLDCLQVQNSFREVVF